MSETLYFMGETIVLMSEWNIGAARLDFFCSWNLCFFLGYFGKRTLARKKEFSSGGIKKSYAL
jgi:hypothetical protein